MEDSPQVVLVRHGETEWSVNGRHTGRTDIPLTERGEEQARAAGRVLEGRRFGLVLSSPRRRALETAVIAGFPYPQTDDNLAEWDYGAYEGLTSPEIAEQYGEGWNLWRDGVRLTEDGAGEQPEDVLRRDLAVLDRIRPVLDRGEDVLLFSHGHYLRSFAAAWIGADIGLGEALALDTAAVCVLGFEHDNHVLRQWNRTPWQEGIHSGL